MAARGTIQQYFQALQKAQESQDFQAHHQAFENLLHAYAMSKNLESFKISDQENIFINSIGLVQAQYQSISQEGKLNEQLPQASQNLLIKSSQFLRLIQAEQEVIRLPITELTKLDELLNKFLDYEATFIKDLKEALSHWTQQIPLIHQQLQAFFTILLGEKKAQDFPQFPFLKDYKTSAKFILQFQKVLETYRDSVFAPLQSSHLIEILLQHILSKPILLSIYPNNTLYTQNPIALEIESLINPLLDSNIQQNILDKWNASPSLISQVAAQFTEDTTKAFFFNQIFQNFRNAYPSSDLFPLLKSESEPELAKFLVQGIDYLLTNFLNINISKKGIHCLDPSAGSGQLLGALLNHFSPTKLKTKYSQDIHGNEVSLLPYYLIQLRLDEILSQKIAKPKAFNLLALVNTLDRLLPSSMGKQTHLFASKSLNTTRLEQQFSTKVSCILSDLSSLGANSKDKRNAYAFIDQRIKNTYGKSPHQSTSKLFHPVLRYLRWATDRLKDSGIIAFLLPRVILEAQHFQGLRKLLREEFSDIYFVDIAKNRVALFLIKNSNLQSQIASIYYASLPDLEMYFEELKFEIVEVDSHHNWINPSNDQFNDLIPLIEKPLKVAREDAAIFRHFLPGIKTNYEEWFYDLDSQRLSTKAEFFFNIYNFYRSRWQAQQPKPLLADFLGQEMKWTSDLLEKLQQNTVLEYHATDEQSFAYRPFQLGYFYLNKLLLPKNQHNPTFLAQGAKQNKMLVLSGIPTSKAFQAFASPYPGSSDLLDKAYYLPFYRIDENGQALENISNWGLEQFQNHYETQWHEQASSNLYYLKTLLNFSEFEHCQVSPELAQEVRRLIQLEERSQEMKHLFQTLNHPDEKTEEYFKKIAQTFTQVQKVFKRIGERASRSKESYDILANYFEEGEEARDALQDYLSGENGQNPFAMHFHLEKPIRKADIFYYVYAVLHHPHYLEKYHFNLQREYPRIPFYKNFWQWVDWGNSLWHWHSLQKPVEPWPLKITENQTDTIQVSFTYKLYKSHNEVILLDQDSEILIEGIPPQVWEYRIANRTALEWLLEQYKVKKPKSPQGQEKIPSFQFQDHKARCLQLLQQLVRISVDTLRIQQDMNLEED